MIPQLRAVAPSATTKCSATIRLTRSRISALKNQLVVALVIAGTITIEIPIFVCGLIGVLLEFSLSLAASKMLAVAENLENWRKPPAQMEHCNGISVEK